MWLLRTNGERAAVPRGTRLDAGEWNGRAWIPRIRCAFPPCIPLARVAFSLFIAHATLPWRRNLEYWRGLGSATLNRELEKRKLHARPVCRSDSLAVLGDAPISDVMQKFFLSLAAFASRNDENGAG